MKITGRLLFLFGAIKTFKHRHQFFREFSKFSGWIIWIILILDRNNYII